MFENSELIPKKVLTRRQFNASFLKSTGKIILSYSVLSGMDVFLSGKKLFAGTTGTISFSPEMPDAVLFPDMGIAPNKPFAYEHRYEVILPDSQTTLYFAVLGADGKLDVSWEIKDDSDPLKKHVYVRFSKGLPGVSANIQMVFSDVPVGIEDKKPTINRDLILFHNYPNPFNPSTEIKYRLPARSFVTIQIYNMRGKLIKTLLNCSQPAGNYKIRWNGRDKENKETASGVYVGLLKSGTAVKTIKMVKLK